MAADKKLQSWDDIHYDVFPKQWCLREFTDEEREILLGGGIVHLPDCRSRFTNRGWECDVYWGETEGHPH